MRIILLVTILFLLFLQLSCKKYKPADDAFFIEPGLVSVKTSASQGSGSHKITELYVYVDGFFKGAYPTGKKIPIPSKGKRVNIQVFAGIINNGIKGTRIYSPFYEFLSFDTLVPNNTTFKRPFTFKYFPSANFPWVENFENQSGTLIKSAKSEIGYEVISGADCFEGKSLKMLGTATTNILMLESFGNGFELPLANPNVYLELNYKCNYDITVGLINNNGEELEALHLNPQANWNKIYISLAGAANTSTSNNKFKVFFRSVKTGDNPPTLYLDNIKLVYLK